MSHVRRHLAAIFASVVLAGAGASAPALAGPKVYVGNFKDNTVSAVDVDAKKIVATIPVPPGPHGMAVTPDARLLLVSSDGASTVSVIDTAADRLVENIEVGRNPHGVAVTPDGRTALVAVYDTDTVALIDVATRKVIAGVPVGRPHNIAIHPNGRVAYVGSQVPGKFGLAVIDLATRAVTASVPLDKTPRGLEFGPDGKHLYYTVAGLESVVVLDPATNATVAQIAVGVSPHYANFTRNGRHGLVAVQGPSQLAVFSPATNILERSIGVGRQPHWVAASADGRYAFTTNEGSNDLSVVELATGSVAAIPVGNGPRKIAVAEPVRPAASGPQIHVAGFAFAPTTLAARVGETITWINEDGAPHAVAVKGERSSDVLLPGASYSARFERPGTYDYVCSIHPYMTGQLVLSAR